MLKYVETNKAPAAIENGRNYTGAVPKPVTCLLWQICGFGEDMGKVMKIGQNT